MFAAMAGTGRPKTKRVCNSNSEKFYVPARVTITVSWGRGDNSEKYTVPFTSLLKEMAQLP